MTANEMKSNEKKIRRVHSNATTNTHIYTFNVLLFARLDKWRIRDIRQLDETT